MKKLSRILMMMLVLSVGTGITSCDEIEDMIDNPVVPEPTPTPQPEPQPEPQPQPEPTPQPTPEEIEAQRITEVQTLMEESRQEGSITEVYYTEDGVEKVANFKRVGNKYVLQTPSATRGDNNGSLVPGLMDDDSDEDLEDDDDDDDGKIQEEFINEDEDDGLDDEDDDDCDVIPMPFDEDEIEEADDDDDDDDGTDDDDDSAAGSRMMTRGKTNVKNGLLYFTDISTGRDGYQISLYHNSGTFSGVMDDEVKVNSISFGGKVAVNGKVFYVKQKAETRAYGNKKIKIRKVYFKNKNHKMPLQANLILQVQISPTNAYVKKITWKSKKKQIAIVNKAGLESSTYLEKCKLTSKKTGKVTICCNAKGCKNANKKKCSCTVTVTNAYLHPVEGITVYPSSLSLRVGETKTLSYIISPDNASNKSVVWKTSDRTIVSVDDGTIEAHRVGKATIIVTSIDGKYTASCSVTVNAAPAPDPEPEPEPEPVPTEDPNSTLAKPDNFNSGDSPF